MPPAFLTPIVFRRVFKPLIAIKNDPLCESFFMAGDEGFEPPIVEPESTALPLGQSPIANVAWLL